MKGNFRSGKKKIGLSEVSASKKLGSLGRRRTMGKTVANDAEINTKGLGTSGDLGGKGPEGSRAH